MIETFATVAKQRSFAAAAIVLGQPPTTVSRKVAALEAQLNTQLLLRTTRSVKLTQEGKSYLETVLPLVRSLQDAEAFLSETSRAPTGQLVLTSPVRLGHAFLTPVIAEFLTEYPNVSIKHLLSEQRLDYTEAKIDVGLRVGKLKDSTFKWIPLGEVRVLACASPEYLQTVGEPKTLDELSDHRTIAFSQFGDRARWRFADTDGRETLVDIDPVYSTDSVDAMVRFAVSGGGIGNFYSYQVADQIAEGKLRPVLSEHEVGPRPVFFLFQDTGHMPNRTRVFLDFATPALRSRLRNSLEMIC